MTARNLLLALLTLLSVAACLALPLIPETTQPFNGTVVPVGNEPVLKILPSSLGLSMPAGLQAGDEVYFSDLSPHDRSYFMTGNLNSPAGTVMTLVVTRADGKHTVVVPLQPVGFLSGSAGNRITQLVAYILILVVTALGLLLLWRGQTMAALGVALWCFTLPIENLLGSFPIPLPYALIVSRIGTTSSAVLTLVGLYLVAISLGGYVLKPETRRNITWAFVAVLLAYTAGVIIFDFQFYYEAAISAEATTFVRVIHLIGFAIPLVMLVAAYARASAQNQARIRWVLFSLLGLVATYILGILPIIVNMSATVLNITSTLLSAVSFIGFAYAVLRHQLVSLQLVVNRALVYGLITSLVVGVFAALLSFLEHETLNTETNRLLALLVPLILGMGLDTIKRQVNTYLGKIFFRKRHESEAALAQFARSAGHVDDQEKLLDLTADELFRRSGPQGLAIYLAAPGTAGATLARQKGQAPFPSRLDSNDLAFLRLKAGDVELDLRGIGSALGTDGNVYALSIRNQVLGFIVMGPRPAESYTAEERRLFELVAHQVGVALHALRLEEQRKLLEELADGGFNSLPTAQAKAKELIGAAG